MSDRDFYWLYSATKVLVCAAALRLVEQKLLDLEAPVERYLPAWKDVRVEEGDALRPPKQTLLVRHLFAMQGGLDYQTDCAPIREALARYKDRANTRQLVDALAQKPLNFDPGTRFKYSLCHDVLGAVMEAAAGCTLGEILQRNVFDPCVMPTASFHPTVEQLERMSRQYTWDESAHRALPHDQRLGFYVTDFYESGGAGVSCRVDDYIRFSDAMACGGVAATGERILRPESIDLMRTNRQHGQCLLDFWGIKPDFVNRYGYGLGVRARLGAGGEDFAPMGDFGWDGAAGCFTFMNPAHRLSVFFAMQVLNCGYAYKVVHPTIQRMVYDAAGIDG